MFPKSRIASYCIVLSITNVSVVVVLFSDIRLVVWDLLTRVYKQLWDQIHLLPLFNILSDHVHTQIKIQLQVIYNILLPKLQNSLLLSHNRAVITLSRAMCYLIIYITILKIKFGINLPIFIKVVLTVFDSWTKYMWSILMEVGRRYEIEFNW